MLVSILCDSNNQIICIVNLALQVKQLEDGVVDLVKAADECTHLSSSIQSIGKDYQPAAEVSLLMESFMRVLILFDLAVSYS